MGKKLSDFQQYVLDAMNDGAHIQEYDGYCRCRGDAIYNRNIDFYVPRSTLQALLKRNLITYMKTSNRDGFYQAVK